MRQGLEKSYEEFKEKLEAFQKQRTDALDLQHPKKPSPSPEKSHVEKMVGISKGGYHEVSIRNRKIDSAAVAGI